MEYRRRYQEGASFFFTVVTEGRIPLLITHIERLREAFRSCLAQHSFEIEAITVLPDHIHTLWRMPEDDADYSKYWMKIKRKFSSGLTEGQVNKSKSRKREKGIWQRRFWEHQVRDENDWRLHVDYIHYNAVKHGYVDKPGDWPYSSYHRALENGWYEEDQLFNDKVRELDLE